MDISDFGEDAFERQGGEEDLAKLAAALGMSYEIKIDGRPPCPKGKGESYFVTAYVRLKGLKSKRCAVFVWGGNAHAKRFSGEVTFMAGARFSARRVRDAAARSALGGILAGCAAKVSKTRHVRIPPSASVDECLLKLAVAGGHAA